MTDQPLPFDDFVIDEPPEPQEGAEAPDLAEAPEAIGQHPYEFLTGPAGTGKTFLVKEAAAADRSLVLCATTGIASINLGAGTTINSFGGYFDTKSLQDSYTGGWLTARLGKQYKAGVRRLVLDEVSMLSGDQLTIWVRALDELASRGYVVDSQDDELEDVNRAEGIGLTLTGDFAQLAPVKETFAFESPEWARFAAHTTVLRTVRRQSDQDFVRALQATRRGDAAGALAFFGGRLSDAIDDTFPGLTIFAKNESVDRYNRLRLDKVTGEPVVFRSSRWGKQRSEWGNPEKPKATWGIPEDLHLKVGALVMILANQRNPLGYGFMYVNGDLGVLEGGSDQVAYVRLQRTGEVVPVVPVERKVTQPADAARRKALRAEGLEDRVEGKFEILGGITYCPLRLAYASTVHKTQGLSLDRVQVTLGDAFFKTPGMLYVALSRARTPEGLRIVGSTGMLAERCVVDPRLRAWL